MVFIALPVAVHTMAEGAISVCPAATFKITGPDTPTAFILVTKAAIVE